MNTICTIQDCPTCSVNFSCFLVTKRRRATEEEYQMWLAINNLTDVQI